LNRVRTLPILNFEKVLVAKMDAATLFSVINPLFAWGYESPIFTNRKHAFVGMSIQAIVLDMLRS